MPDSFSHRVCSQRSCVCRCIVVALRCVGYSVGKQTAAYTVEIWKRFRKWGGIPTGITQNIKDLLASREIENIFENSDYICMLNQAAGDREILAKKLNISPNQLNHVTSAAVGSGLLFFGDTIIPFVNNFPKDTQLYRLMTTRLSEVKPDAGGRE